jgi:predicted ribosomally synthesized peptide with SipW-like signal peptide
MAEGVDLPEAPELTDIGAAPVPAGPEIAHTPEAAPAQAEPAELAKAAPAAQTTRAATAPKAAKVKRRSMSKKVLLSLFALGTAAAMAGLGTFAAYTSTTSASNSVTTGVVHIALGTDLTSANRISVAATGVLPGDTVARAVDLTSTSTDALSSVKLTTTASPSSTLNTDTTNGLQLIIQKCTTTWTETANTAPQTGYSYTCGGSTTTVFGGASTPVIQTAVAFTGLAAIAGPGNVTPTLDHLLITMTLPSATIESQVAQGSTSTITFAFNASQRTGPTSR